MEELIDIDNYNEKLKDLKEKVSKTEKKKTKEQFLSKESKKLKVKNKYQKYIILTLSLIIVFISYHLLLQYIDNLQNQVSNKEKLLLSYQQNINDSLKELSLIEEENELIKKEINQYKEKYADYYIQYENLKKENNRLIEQSNKLYKKGNKYRDKYNKYKKDFENISNAFHSFFDTN